MLRSSTKKGGGDIAQAVGHGPLSTRPAKKKGRREGALKLGKCFWGSCKILENRLEGSHDTRVAATLDAT